MGERRDFKFAGQVDHVNFQPTGDKKHLKVAWSRLVTNVKYWGPSHNPGNY